jgi:cytochrome P450
LAPEYPPFIRQSFPGTANGNHPSIPAKNPCPGIYARALSSYIPTIESITRTYCHKWHEIGELAWYPELRHYTLDVACKLLVGVDNGSQTRLGTLFETWCAGLFSLPINLPWTRFGKAQRARQLLLEELTHIIQTRQQNPSGTGDNALDLLLDAVDESGNHLELAELKDQVLLLLFAGHETLTSAIASFCLLVSQHPAILAQLRQEQAQFDSQVLSLETLKQMTYLEQVLKEVMRKIPPVGGGFRKVLQTCEFQGYQIPSGWNVLYQIGLTMRMNISTPCRKNLTLSGLMNPKPRQCRNMAISLLAGASGSVWVKNLPA